MRRLIFPLILGLGGAGILISLGVWQLDRLGQKQAMLAGIGAAIAAPPGPLPAAPVPDADQYRAVEVSGAYLPGGLRVLTSAKGLGPGYRVIAPFLTDAGHVVMVDRGFLSEASKTAPIPTGRARIEGNLMWPNEIDSYTPAPDTATGLWFARDVPAMAEALGTEPVLVVVRATSETGLPVAPMPVDTAAIPNHHLNYAITWFGLAVVWLGMTALMIRRTLRRED